MRKRYGRRSRPPRQFARRILVVTEGRVTEPEYVERLADYLRSKGATAIVRPVAVGKDPVKVIQKSIELRDDAAKKQKEYDFCVCLVDFDRHASLQEACKLANQESILLLVTRLKFETWLLWHVDEDRTAYSSSQLDDIVEKKGLTKGKALSSNFPFKEVHKACEIARRADPHLEAGRVGLDPSSAMPLLVDLMLGR